MNNWTQRNLGIYNFSLYHALGITDQLFDGYINFRVRTWFNEYHSFAPWLRASAKREASFY